ncbi:MAG: peptide deformylase [Pseudomonadota bacterium]
MATLQIRRAGHPILRQVAQSIGDPTDPDIKRLVADMVETMDEAGGVGLAAPQVGISLRLVIFLVPEGRLSDDPEDTALPLTVLINPVITPLGDAQVAGWEGCLSLPGLRGLVPRAQRIHYRALDLDGAVVERTVAGFHARVVQHECDHLDGRLYPSRMTDLATLGFAEEFSRAAAEAAEKAAPDGD